MAYWHDEALSPDPTGTLRLEDAGGGWRTVCLYPHAIARCSHPLPALPLAIQMSVPIPLQLHGEELDLVVDFGTELDGALGLGVVASSAGSFAISFGESLWEAREWGPASACEGQRPRKQHWHVVGAGTHERRFEEGGFRFVRLRAVDFTGTLTLVPKAIARFALGAPQGSFRCSDARLQRLWQSSLYTARLCTRPDEIWDGIKRDRMGWYGDARVTSLTVAQAFCDPRPAMGMLQRLGTETWANHIPGFSFDAIAMLHRHILTYGVNAYGVADVYEKSKRLLGWIRRTQLGDDGRLHRREGVEYFFDIGFIDWSPQPLGGRLEELSPVQFAFLEALHHWRDIARWMDDPATAETCQGLASRLMATLQQRFWRDGVGFDHTLNQAEPQGTAWRMPLENGLHYRKTYQENLGFGPSGPSFHAAARAVLSGCVRASELPTVRRNLSDASLPPIITGFYQYYVNRARALAGDGEAALSAMCSYLAPIVEEHDSPTLWESFEPDVQGIRALSLGAWPKSLCHGWSSGLVPLVSEFLLGVQIVAPGTARVRLAPALHLPCSVQAAVATPHGPIHCTLEDGRTSYRVPRAIEVEADPAEVTVIVST